MLDASYPIPDRPNRGPRDLLAAMVRAWRRERALRAATLTLAAMDDHTLRDMGISRGDIGSIVRRGRELG